MIRIQLIHEGRVVKQISSRVHEGVVLEQVKRYQNPIDDIVILEGELSEDAKGILSHVAKRVIPAAMAAGVALGGSAHAQNRDFPGLDRSIGQHISDVFSPNYKEIQRQRNYERDTQRQEWNAEQNELRKARLQTAQQRGRSEAGVSSQGNVKVYDQARTSADGKYYIMYGLDNSIVRIPTKGTEFMQGDSQRLPHYISPSGAVYYVRHNHLNESVEGGRYYSEELAQRVYDQNPDLDASGRADAVLDAGWPIAVADLGKKSAQYKFAYDEDFPSDFVSAYAWLQQNKQGVAESNINEFAPVGGDDREPNEEEILRQLAAQWWNGDEDPRAEKTLAAMGWEIGQDESGDDDAGVFLIRSGDVNGDTYIAFNQSDLELHEGMATPGTIPASGTNQGSRGAIASTGPTSSGGQGSAEEDDTTNPDGTTNVDIDDQGMMSIGKPDEEVDEATELNSLQAILHKFPGDYAKFKAGGDIDENPDFFDALFGYYMNTGEMPYGVQKARDGDPYEWITNKLDDESDTGKAVDEEVEQISKAMAPVLEAQTRAKQLIKSVFGNR